MESSDTPSGSAKQSVVGRADRRWAVGGAVYALGLGLAGAVLGVRPLAAVAQAIVTVTPGSVATATIETLGKNAQPLLVVGVGIGLVGSSVAAERVLQKLPDSIRDDLLGAIGFALVTFVGFALAGGGFAQSLVGTALATAPVLLGRWLLVARHADDRREFLRRAGVAGVALAGVGGAAATVSRLGTESTTGPQPGESLAEVGSDTDTATAAEREKTQTGRTEPNTATVTPGSTGTESEAGMLDSAAKQVPVTVSESDSDDPFGFEFDGMPAALTPVGDHYVVDKQLDDPDLTVGDWQLTVGIGDATERSTSFSLSDLVGHPDARQQVVTMVCVSNPVAGPLTSTMRWRGVPLNSLLSEVGVTDEAVDVVTEAADNYSEALPVEEVQARDDIMLVYGMNGQTLPEQHGFPARLLIPGRYGMKMTKWVTGLGAVARDFDGYWGERGWSEEAPVQTLSAIRAAQRRGDRVGIGGIAFAGTRGLQRVEVSLDGGETWNEATLEDPLSPTARQRWRYVTESTDGTVEAVVRATDGTGTVQTKDRSRPHPNGATGWHRPTIDL